MSEGEDNSALYTTSIEPPWDLGAWRNAARAALRAGLAPEHIAWGGDAQAGLLLGTDVHDARVIQKTPNVSSALFDLAAMVLCHRDPQRHALLYRIAWRMASGERHLLAHATDPDIHHANRLAKAVGRDTHKMKAFVRFKAVPGEDNAFIAWFEPEHWIVDRVAPFFARRFAGMRWAILTPYRSVVWDGQSLSLSAGAQRSDAPIDDAREDLWRTYYANIFNPARLNPRMMRQEMPQKYWKHLPEAHLLPELIQTAGQRVREMAERVPEAPRRKIPSRNKPEQG
jgi:uracil-DNA glycosylase